MTTDEALKYVDDWWDSTGALNKHRIQVLQHIANLDAVVKAAEEYRNNLRDGYDILALDSEEVLDKALKKVGYP